jgi:hypothetical protein
MFLRSQKLNLRLEKVPRDQGDCLDRRGTIATEGFIFGGLLEESFLEEVLTATLFPNK